MHLDPCHMITWELGIKFGVAATTHGNRVDVTLQLVQS
jgi:hypothetical protein